MQTDVLQICRNGHLVTDRLRSCPEDSRPYCDRCGAPTMFACSTCGKDIAGSGLTLSGRQGPPHACAHCGAIFPWSQRAAGLTPAVRTAGINAPARSDERFPLETLLRRLPLVIRQLRDRRPNRPAFRVQDDHDLEDLLRSILPLVAHEVWPRLRTPAYSACSRTDFLLPKERVVVTSRLVGAEHRNDLLDRQLAEDAAVYAEEVQCETLWFFLYDPERRLRDAAELERRWSSLESRPIVRCVISGSHGGR